MKIDFVILWVDGKDPLWNEERNKYVSCCQLPQALDDANGECRYRGEEELLRFWFRGVEKNAPWVHKIYFISCGQIPSWLNTTHPNLRIINHTDFIPEEFLPTFNNRPIHFNLHRIKDLSEHFVLLDDDTFLLNEVKPDMFFRKGEPVLQTYLGYLNKGNNNWNRVLWNDYALINTHFNVAETIWKNRRKWFNIRQLGFAYAAFNYFCFRINKTIPVYTFGHLAHPHLKSTIKDVWDAFPDDARRTCMQKFRSDDQLNQYLFLSWNQACGLFFPVSIDHSLGRFFTVNPETLNEICRSIERERYPIICINDSYNNSEFENATKAIIDSFAGRFPDKSAFEK